MINSLFGFYDRITGTYTKFFVAVNQEDALRIASASLSSFPFAGDLDMFQFCDVDIFTGAVESYEAKRPVFVCRLADLIRNGGATNE